MHFGLHCCCCCFVQPIAQQMFRPIEPLWSGAEVLIYGPHGLFSCSFTVSDLIIIIIIIIVFVSLGSSFATECEVKSGRRPSAAQSAPATCPSSSRSDLWPRINLQAEPSSANRRTFPSHFRQKCPLADVNKIVPSVASQSLGNEAHNQRHTDTHRSLDIQLIGDKGHHHHQHLQSAKHRHRHWLTDLTHSALDPSVPLILTGIAGSAVPNQQHS